jgi:hypothetical protein
LPFTRGSQSAVEEFGGGAVGADPVAAAKQVMEFRRGRLSSSNSESFDRSLPALSPSPLGFCDLCRDFPTPSIREKFFDLIGGLLERHVRSSSPWMNSTASASLRCYEVLNLSNVSRL